MDPTNLFRAMSDETRLRCLNLIRAKGEMCVCDFTGILKLSQPKVSRHLAYLRSCRVVKDRRVRTLVFYRLSEELPDWAIALVDATVKNIAQQSPYREDLVQLDCVDCRSDRQG